MATKTQGGIQAVRAGSVVKLDRSKEYGREALTMSERRVAIAEARGAESVSPWNQMRASTEPMRASAEEWEPAGGWLEGTGRPIAEPLSALVVAESKSPVRSATTALLRGVDPRMQIGRSVTREGARSALLRESFDLLLLDVDELDDDWSELIGRLARVQQALAIVVWARSYSEEAAMKVIELGAQEFMDAQISLAEATQRVSQAVARQRRGASTHQELLRWRFLATHDSLTRLPSRTLMMERLGQALRVAERKGTFVAALCIDLESFGELNERHGCARGDEALVLLAKRLRAAVRSTDILARSGGDEFMVVQGDVADTAEAVQLGRRLLETVETASSEQLGEAISANIGIAVFGGDAQAEAVADAAFAAACFAKRSGSRFQVQVSEELEATSRKLDVC
jgi:diguanylate cyclase (GGDEF)-like protein